MRYCASGEREPTGKKASTPPIHMSHETNKMNQNTCRVRLSLLTVALLPLFSGQAMATDLIFNASQPDITTALTADNSFWVGNTASGVIVNIVSPGSVDVNGGVNSAALGVTATSDNNRLGIRGASAALMVDGSIYVGYFGAFNAMTVEQGADVSSGSFYMGAELGSTDNTFDLATQGQVITTGDAAIGVASGVRSNSAIVTGTGSLWSIDGNFYVGNAAAGNSLTISDGAVVEVDTLDMLLGAAPGADNNTVLVTDNTSMLSNLSPLPLHTLYVGRSGNTNSMQIASRGLVNSGNVRIGGGSGATGTPTGNSVSVDGTGSTWNIAGTLRVGAGTVVNTDSGLDITDGGVVNVTGNSFVGYDAASDDNHVLVSGTGSQLNLAAFIISPLLGSTGNVVTLADGGVLSATSITIGGAGGPNASGLTIGTGAAPGSISPATTITGAAPGSDPHVRFNHNSVNYNFDSSLAGTVGVSHDGSGTTFLTGTNAYTGETTVNGGVLALNAITATSGVTVNAGTLGVIASADATTTGDYTQAAGGTYRTYIADNTNYGSLHVAGTAYLPTTTQINVAVTNCGAVTPGTTFTGIMTSTNNISVSGFTVTDNCPGLAFTASLSNDSRAINLVANVGPSVAIPTLSGWASIFLAGLLAFAAGMGIACGRS